METNPEFRQVRSKYVVITADYLAPALIVIVCGLAWWVVFYTQVFAVKHVECELDFAPCDSPSILAEINKYKGGNLLRINESKIRDRLTGADFTVREVDISRHLPDTLTLSLQSVYPAVAAQVKGDTSWVTFDDQLRVIGIRGQYPNVPAVIVRELVDIQIGEKLKSDGINTVLRLAQTLSQELSGITSVELQGTDITLALDSGMSAILTTARDQGEQLRALQAVLADATILSGKSVIDVRFARPVLR